MPTAWHTSGIERFFYVFRRKTRKIPATVVEIPAGSTTGGLYSQNNTPASFACRGVVCAGIIKRLNYHSVIKRFWLEHTAWLAPLLGLLLLVSGIIIGKTTTPTAFQSKVLRESGYKYIAPVLLCNTNPNQDVNNDEELQSLISSYINKNNRTDDISAYVLELKSGGKWAGVNENSGFAPASMLKVPTMLAVLKYAETHPGFLEKQVYYDGSFDDNRAEAFKPTEVIKAGAYHDINELLHYMIVYSDNNAARLLSESIDQRSLISIYINLGIQLPADATESIDFMSAKTYALFLRVLYNSTYLSRENSEKALGLMTEASFPQGLQAGIPDSIAVAHKFGEREVYTQNGALSSRELHDCGIVYTPRNRYIICVMTRGNKFDQLSSAIQGISKIVYDHMTLENK